MDEVGNRVFVGDFEAPVFGGGGHGQHKRAVRGFPLKIPRGLGSGHDCGTGGGPRVPIANEQSRKQGRYRGLSAADATSDRVGTRGAKLLNGFRKTPLAGRPIASLPVRPQCAAAPGPRQARMFLPRKGASMGVWLAPEELDMQVIGNQQGQPLDFLTSLLRRGGGLFDNNKQP